MIITLAPPQNITSIDLGTSSPKLGGVIDVTSFINLVSFEAYEGTTGNDIDGFIISETNYNLELVRLLYNKLTGSANQYMPQNVVNFQIQENELDEPLSDLSSFTQLEVIATSNNPNMGGSIPSLPSGIKELDLGKSGITGDLPPLGTYTSMYKCWLYLNDISIPSNWTAPAGLNEIRLQGCSLSSTEVNTLLVEIDSLGSSNGCLMLQVNGAPTGAGLTAKSNLIARGWDVTTS
jgi:hypothetical protein